MNLRLVATQGDEPGVTSVGFAQMQIVAFVRDWTVAVKLQACCKPAPPGHEAGVPPLGAKPYRPPYM